MSLRPDQALLLDELRSCLRDGVVPNPGASSGGDGHLSPLQAYLAPPARVCATFSEGDYQGSVYAIIALHGKFILWRDSYGSCSGCDSLDGIGIDGVRDYIAGTLSVGNVLPFDTLAELESYLDDKRDDEGDYEWHGVPPLSGRWLFPDAAAIGGKVDSHGRLHCVDGPALELQGGKVYALKGVRIPEAAIAHPESLTFHTIANEPNIEVRRVLMERLGTDEILRLGATIIHTDTDGAGQPRQLIAHGTVGSGEWKRPAVLLLSVRDPSTGRNYLLHVPETMKTCHEATAWTFGCRPEEYKPLKET